MAINSEERKRRILDHVSRTSPKIAPKTVSAPNGRFAPSGQSSSTDARKRRILDHVQRTRG